MYDFGQGPIAKKHPSRSQAWWNCCVTTLAFCLWACNFLPIQSVHYLLTTNIAISQHRLPLLNKMAATGCDPELSGVHVLKIEADEAQPVSLANSELRAVRVQIRLDSRGLATTLENQLFQATEPSLDSDECQTLSNNLRKETWLLESSQHALKRFEMDLDRERLAIESTPTPFRLTTFRPSHLSDQQQSLKQQLQSQTQAHAEKVEAMKVALSRLRDRAKGFLSFTGSARLDPQVPSLTLSRLTVLALLAIAVWWLLVGWVDTFPGQHALQRWYRRKPQSSVSNSGPSQTKLSSISSPADSRRTVRWLHQAGVPYLGSIEWYTPSNNLKVTNPTSASDRTTQPAENAPSPNHANLNSPLAPIRQKPMDWMRSLGEGSLVLWIGLFVARCMFDPAWRELVMVSPIAAISRMVFGIH